MTSATTVQIGTIVTNTNDSGPGSLRQAILNSNSASGQQTIKFNIPGSGVRTINLLSPLPNLSDPVIIDGTTQPGFSGTPIIEVNGANAGGSVGCFALIGGNNTIKGLVMNRFSGTVIHIANGGGNTIQGNYIGTNASGTAASPNSVGGIFITNSNDNLIGGSTAPARNVISGNGNGIEIINGSTGNQVLGNYIGTNAAGTAPISNGNNGITINGVSNNVIGGTAPGAGNVVSGNNNAGVAMFNGATGNLVQGNYVGTSASGTSPIPNGLGIGVNGSNNEIGGLVVGARNLVSGNTNSGIFFSGNTSTGNWVKGNFIGTDVTGTLALPNRQNGVLIEASASSNLIGGNVPEARNVISGNKAGVQIGLAMPANNNTVQGNYIGLTADGNAALGNQFDGVDLVSSSGNNVTGNVVSANGAGGISLFTANNNFVQSNLVGTNASGTAPLGNSFEGIFIGSSSGNTIGGTSSATGNLISANRIGLVLSDLGSFNTTGSSNNVAQGNFIGTDISGNSPIGNNAGGVSIVGSSSNNLIGGNAAGAGNVISSNNGDGVSLRPGASGNIVQGNRIGTNVSGLGELGNAGRGVFIESSNNTVGGLGPNTIAFNNNEGIFVSSGLSNAILSNSIFSNGGRGIVLAGGGNKNQSAPLLKSVTVSGGLTSFEGTITSTANTNFTLQFFANDTCDPLGSGEGQIFLGSTPVSTDSSGSSSFNVTLSSAMGATFITATATDANNNTSTFSLCRATGPDLKITEVTPVQVVYGADLVKGKRMAVRVRFQADTLSALTARSIGVSIDFDGGPYPVQDIPFDKSRDCKNAICTLVYNPPESPIIPLTPGLRRLNATLDPNGNIDAKKDNNTLAEPIQVNVVETKPLKVGYLPINECSFGVNCYGGPVQNFASSLAKSDELIKAVYPLSSDGYKAEVIDGQVFGNDNADGGQYEDLIVLNRMAYRLGLDAVLGVVPAGYFPFHGRPNDGPNGEGTSGMTKPKLASAGGIVREGYWGAPAHEIGHLYGLWTQSITNPFNLEEYDLHSPGRDVNGYWVDQGRAIEPGLGSYCFMGAGLLNFDHYWVDTDDYEYLLSKLTLGQTAGLRVPTTPSLRQKGRPGIINAAMQSTAPDTPEMLVITALLYSNGTLSLRPWDKVSNAAPTTSEDGNYSVRVYDSAGRILSELTMPVTFTVNLESTGSVDTDTVPLVVVVPYPSNAATVEILDQGTVIASVSPQSKLLRDAINSIPDSGFVRNPAETRNALLNKVKAIENQIAIRDYYGARQKMLNDLRKHVESWLLDGYSKNTPLQFEKPEVLQVIDDTAARLQNLAQGGQGQMASFRNRR
jgi:parallel beta-helix repeat protein